MVITTLHEAARAGEDDTVYFLLDNGTDPNTSKGANGYPLHAAYLRAKLDTVRRPLDCGADVNAQSGIYRTALQYACIWSNKDNSLELVKLLPCKGADVNARRGSMGSALKAAAIKHKPKLVRLLLDHGASIDDQDGFGTAIAAAAEAGCNNIIVILLERDANINAGPAGILGFALQAAAASNFPRTFELFLRRGADVNRVGGYLGSALRAAARCGSKEVVEIPLAHGAEIDFRGGEDGNAVAAARHGRYSALAAYLEAKRVGADAKRMSLDAKPRHRRKTL